MEKFRMGIDDPGKLMAHSVDDSIKGHTQTKVCQLAEQNIELRSTIDSLNKELELKNDIIKKLTDDIKIMKGGF